mmetsp:Transcript_77025/g.220634  ORF Transcript_77025/g.220634 Transcript_77025/m.220634 type:complete len:236 (+) Transcript_77025:287-994(+)
MRPPVCGLAGSALPEGGHLLPGSPRPAAASRPRLGGGGPEAARCPERRHDGRGRATLATRARGGKRTAAPIARDRGGLEPQRVGGHPDAGGGSEGPRGGSPNSPFRIDAPRHPLLRCRGRPRQRRGRRDAGELGGEGRGHRGGGTAAGAASARSWPRAFRARSRGRRSAAGHPRAARGQGPGGDMGRLCGEGGSGHDRRAQELPPAVRQLGERDCLGGGPMCCAPRCVRGSAGEV